MSAPEMPMGRNVKPVHITNGPTEPVPVTGMIGPTQGKVITSIADAPLAPTATVPLAVPPAGTIRMRVQVTGGSALTKIRVRELGGPAGSGALLTLLGSTMYGGDGGSIAALEAENTAGPAAAVMIQFERP